MKHIRLMLVIVLLAGGLMTLHYTQADGWDHHAEWARLHGLPPPSFAIYVAGLAASLLASAWAGFLLGRRKTKPQPR